MILIAAASTALGLSQFASAQVSGSWIVDADGLWSTGSNWSSNPNFPTGGGVASFPSRFNLSSNHTVSLDVNVALAGITFGSPFAFTIEPFNGGETITLTGAANIAVNDGPTIFSPQLAQVPAHTISATIAGSSGLNKTGSGGLLLQGVNTFTGGVNISSGVLYALDTQNAALGNLSNGVTLSNGAAFSNIPSNPNLLGTFVTARNFVLGTGGGELRNYAPMQITGVISGSGNLVKRISTGSLTLRGANTYSGTTTVRDDGIITLNQGGSIASSSAINLSGTLVLDNLATANTNRVGTVPISTNGGSITLVGNDTNNVNEAVGAITLDGGQSVFNLVGNSAATQISAPSLTRNGKSTALVRGDNFGTGSGAGFTNFTLTAAPALVGGGGAAGATNISIVPWLVGNRASGNTLNAADNTFVTYAANGLRPLDPINEFAPLSGAATTANVAIGSVTTVASNQTINSLVLRGQNVSGSGALTITSGAVLVSVAGGTYASPLNFNSAEAVVQTTSSGTFSGVISGSGGLTKSGANAMTITGANTYSGTTTIVAGSMRVQSDVLSTGVAGPLGTSTSAIVMQGGVGVTVPRLYATLNGANVKVDRALSISNSTADAIGAIGTAVGSAAGNTFNYNGAIAINNGTLRLEADSTAAAPMLSINGAISGSGRLTDAFGSAHVLAGNNTFTGGTTILAGTYLVGSNTAFGAGSIVFSNTAAPSGTNALPGAIGAFGAPRTIANPILAASFGPNDGDDPSLLGVGIVGTQPLTLSGAIDLGGASRLFTVNNAATTTFSGAISRGGLEKGGTGRLVLSGANTYSGDTAVHSGTLVFAATESNTALSVDSGARAEIAQNGNRILVLRSLTLVGGANPTATLDVFDNDVKVANASYNTIAAQVKKAYDFGSFDLPGIASTSARNDSFGNKMIGALTGDEYFNNNGAPTFDGFAVASTDVLLKYTYFGDVDFNGAIDSTDYNIIDFGFLTGASGWANGDVDYSGSVDSTDYNNIDFAFVTQSGFLRRAISYLDGTDRSTSGMNDASLQEVVQHFDQFGNVYAAGFLSHVPEPGAMMIGVIGIGTLLRRRRRKSMDA